MQLQVNEFEKMMEELSAITEKLESGKLTLSESMELFEKGVGLTKKCSELLESAKIRIMKITSDTEGAVKEEPFDVEEE